MRMPCAHARMHAGDADRALQETAAPLEELTRIAIPEDGPVARAAAASKWVMRSIILQMRVWVPRGRGCNTGCSIVEGVGLVPKAIVGESSRSSLGSGRAVRGCAQKADKASWAIGALKLY